MSSDNNKITRMKGKIENGDSLGRTGVALGNEKVKTGLTFIYY